MRLPIETIPSATWDSIGPQVTLSLLNALFLALLGGLAVNLLLKRAERRHTQRELCQTMSVEMWQVAYSFYWKSQEQIWRHQYGQTVDIEKLAQDYESFRVEARVLEAKLDAYFPDKDASWLWHGAVDMLGVRYYWLAQPASRFSDMIAVHGAHRDDRQRIQNPSIRRRFLPEEQLRDDSAVKAKFVEMLDLGVKIVRAEGGLGTIHI
ncbi:hypothetical protein [Cryobacterium sp. MDB2-33-2]|uniref:hypothetical protein n=1 Tax=Cryobacterium sp. MDB2-33-2 TaxID=1259179 RepID=UPI00106C60CA|nr:hypothetical protein [Cryobacterium sp. MDB2-33-2]TFC02320.1 hypothetical protein E3O59_18800 [Cryobacterium sp. MDB2-33-2]